ncbi:nucleotide sugar dehydrogenase [Patescibacteria group bacterium]|nr:nucleotide sugar dehydrogenase [Patescibacteria group bacterium]
MIFIAVGTPQSPDGSADLSAIKSVVSSLGTIGTNALIVTKSTVPVGTLQKIKQWSGLKRVASNPEFLREGNAVSDFLNPDRIVIGVEDQKDAELLKTLYKKINAPIIVIKPESAELSKYVSNSMLALRLSFMNEIASLCEDFNADIKEVESVVGSDKRIGNKFLQSSAGFGGSCFPKDVRALEASVKSIGRETKLISPIIEVNELQAKYFVDSVEKHIGNLNGATLAVWGLAFKQGTDDVRESPAIRIIKYLIQRGAKVKAFDPQAMEFAKQEIGDEIEFCEDMSSAIAEAKTLLVLTAWPEFLQASWEDVLASLETNLIFDAKNYLPHDELHQIGFDVVGVGLWRMH